MQMHKAQKAVNRPKTEPVIQVDRRFSEGRRSTDLVKRLIVAHSPT